MGAQATGAGTGDMSIVRREWESIADVVGPLRVAVWLPLSAPDAPGRALKTLIEPLDTDDRTVHFVMMREQQIVGAARLTLSYLPNSTLQRAPGTTASGNCYVSRLIVDPAHQGRGIATALVHECAEHARRQGQASIWTETRPLAKALLKRGFEYIAEYTEPQATFVREHVTILRKPLGPHQRSEPEQESGMQAQ